MYKLLVVDDEPLIQVGVKSMVNWAELNIELAGTAMNGQAALKMIEEQSFDIVITDLKMPVMSGLELIKHCREQYGSE
ncbi:MAG: response regulator, partial [Acetatifactor sp.]|nr:response regulator [Acetatifactor sp.]